MGRGITFFGVESCEFTVWCENADGTSQVGYVTRYRDNTCMSTMVENAEKISDFSLEVDTTS